MAGRAVQDGVGFGTTRVRARNCCLTHSFREQNQLELAVFVELMLPLYKRKPSGRSLVIAIRSVPVWPRNRTKASGPNS